MVAKIARQLLETDEDSEPILINLTKLVSDESLPKALDCCAHSKRLDDKSVHIDIRTEARCFYKNLLKHPTICVSSCSDFPVRVSWTFWLGAIVFGYEFAQQIDIIAVAAGLIQPRQSGRCCCCGRLCLLVSILIHELGHALAFRQFGIQSSIVLYHFGGLAIPIGSFRAGASVGRLT